MLVRKQVFNFKELDSIELAKTDCAKHFFNLVDTYVCRCDDTRGLSDRDKILERSKSISIDLNTIILEFFLNKEFILEVDEDRVKQYDKQASSSSTIDYCTFENHLSNILEYTSPEGKTDTELIPDTWSHKIFIKIIKIGEKCYYFYTI